MDRKLLLFFANDYSGILLIEKPRKSQRYNYQLIELSERVRESWGTDWWNGIARFWDPDKIQCETTIQLSLRTESAS